MGNVRVIMLKWIYLSLSGWILKHYKNVIAGSTRIDKKYQKIMAGFAICFPPSLFLIVILSLFIVPSAEAADVMLGYGLVYFLLAFIIIQIFKKKQ